MRPSLPFLAVLLAASLGLGAALCAQNPPGSKLLIAFASYRDRPRHPNIFFYEHDGVASGKIVGSINTPRSGASADAHPSLTPDGRFCAFGFEREDQSGRVWLWDVKGQKQVDLPALNDSPNG